MQKHDQMAVGIVFAAVFAVIAAIIVIAVVESVKMAAFEAEVGRVRWMGSVAQAAWRARGSL